MDFELTEDQEHLRDAARSFLGNECPPSLVRSAYEGRAAEASGGLWKRMVGLDWPGLAIPESLGGLGYGFVELGLLCEELGRVVAPAPFLSTATQFVPMVLETGSEEQLKSLLGPVASGGATGTVALAETGGGWDVGRLGALARKSGTGWVLDGRKAFVFDAATADTVVVVAAAGAGEDPGVFALPRSAAKVVTYDLTDPSQPLADLEFVGAEVPTEGVLIEPGDPRGRAAVTRAVEQSVAALALSMTGTCRAIFEATLQYTKDREQFGKPIGSFQAIKHRLVEMFISLERASSLAYFAALTIAEDDLRRAIAVSMAKTAAGDCQALLAQEGLQLHGGVGYMWEQDLHMHLKRAKSGDFLLGSGSEHRAAVARALGLVA
ncbi:MAG TPA: acyl-CoA dehydrogenase family protein [Acidimicrobiales bacterium]|nr:acyl-CoA dehydrogenase family protein [Acidimicrobiales bacterium]